MASFSELVNDVYTITNRPDLVAETKLAVKQATLKMHHSDYYPKDIYESGITFDSVDYIQSLQYKTLIPRWRTFKYLRKYQDGNPGEFIKLLTPEESVDRYAVNKDNICYIAGDVLEIRSSTQDATMLLGCYLHPVIAEESYTSWIADEHPYAIVFDAAAAIFKMIGQDEQASYMKQTVMEQIALLRQNQII